MTDRIVDLAETPARLRVRYDQLLIEREGEPTHSVPLCDLGALILSNPQVSLTHAVLSGIMERGGAVIACNAARLPVGLMLPVEQHGTQTKRFALQASAKPTLNKRLWKQVVQAKIRAQAAALNRVNGSDGGLATLAARVTSGDKGNLEAQAAQRYWPLLFTDPNFRRRFEADDQNRLLNYGYAVLRAMVGRALCAVGLHPSIGIHHHNQYNPYCLADDLMEPYRPIVDETVVEIVRTRGADAALDREGKAELLSFISRRSLHEGEARVVGALIAMTASSLARVYEGAERRLVLPEWRPVAED